MTKFYKVKVEGNIYEVEVETLSESTSSSHITPSTPSVTPSSVTTNPVATGTGEPINSPMQGNIWKILKKSGESVKAGETIVILEAMKMENNIVAPKDGIIVAILVKEGDSVDSGDTLAELK